MYYRFSLSNCQCTIDFQDIVDLQNQTSFINSIITLSNLPNLSGDIGVICENVIPISLFFYVDNNPYGNIDWTNLYKRFNSLNTPNTQRIKFRGNDIPQVHLDTAMETRLIVTTSLSTVMIPA